MTTLSGGNESGPVPEKERPIEFDESGFAPEQPIQTDSQDGVHDYLGSGGESSVESEKLAGLERKRSSYPAKFHPRSRIGWRPT